MQRLTRVEAFDRYVRKTFLGQKTFSGEGLDVMVPMLEEMLDMLADDGIGDAVLGMAHRGRLNVIAHVVNMPYEEVMTEFEAAQYRGKLGDDDVMGDVKYHHGATGTFTTSKGKTIQVTLAHNPSHLEAVDPVVEGSARALQTDHEHGVPTLDHKRAVPILIHGDAAFTGQGIVSEVFNLQSLPGYETGGTIHLIANNQIGFTTDPLDARSTRYASDLAKGFDVPIVHVNADDVDACIAAVHLAVDFRREFGRDVLIDLIGYRRFGHNEQDEPAYTQPQMADRIKNHPTVRELFANKLVNQGILTADQSRVMAEAATERLQEARRAVKGALATHITGRKISGSNTFDGTSLPKSDAPSSSRGARRWPRRLPASRSTASCRDSSSGATRRSPRRASSIGGPPNRSRSHRCSPRARRYASPAKTPSAARSVTATPSFTRRRRTRALGYGFRCSI